MFNYKFQIEDAQQKIRQAYRDSSKDVLETVLSIAVERHMRQGSNSAATIADKLTIRSGRLSQAVRGVSDGSISSEDSTDKFIVEKKITDSSGLPFPYANVHEKGIPGGQTPTVKQRRYFLYMFIQSKRTDKLWIRMFKANTLKRPARPYISKAIDDVQVTPILIENIKKQFPNATTEVKIGT